MKRVGDTLNFVPFALLDELVEVLVLIVLMLLLCKHLVMMRFLLVHLGLWRLWRVHLFLSLEVQLVMNVQVLRVKVLKLVIVVTSYTSGLSSGSKVVLMLV